MAEEYLEQSSQSFTCPCCQAKLNLKVKHKVTNIEFAVNDAGQRPQVKAEIKRLSKADKLVIEHQTLVDNAKQSGALKAFIQTLDAAKYSKPANIEAYFVRWVQMAAKINTPQFALRQCLDKANLDASGELELMAHDKVALILQNGEFKMFIPRQLINGETIKSLEVKNGMKAKEVHSLDTWVRTKNGYVVQSGAFRQELNKHSIGSFQVK